MQDVVTGEVEKRTLRFGDHGEFTFESCAELKNKNTNKVEELTIFYTDGHRNYGLVIEASDTEGVRDVDPIDDLPPAIMVLDVDPAFVLKAMQMPSADLLKLSVELTELA